MKKHELITSPYILLCRVCMYVCIYVLHTVKVMPQYYKSPCTSPHSSSSAGKSKIPAYLLLPICMYCSNQLLPRPVSPTCLVQTEWIEKHAGQQVYVSSVIFFCERTPFPFFHKKKWRTEALVKRGIDENTPFHLNMEPNYGISKSIFILFWSQEGA